jgi:DNA-binding transcriptional ArsR family regulator
VRGTPPGAAAAGERTADERTAGEQAAGEQAAEEALKAIAEPRRRAILRLVADDELAAGEIAAAFDVTRTAISQHLTVLKNAGLLTERREGTRRLYRARPEGLDGLREFLDDMWAASLDAARQMAEADRGLSDPGPSARAG